MQKQAEWILLPSSTKHNTVNSTFSVLLILISLFLLHIRNLDIVAQLFEHIHEHLINDTGLLVYEPADVRSCLFAFLQLFTKIYNDNCK